MYDADELRYHTKFRFYTKKHFLNNKVQQLLSFNEPIVGALLNLPKLKYNFLVSTKIEQNLSGGVQRLKRNKITEKRREFFFLYFFIRVAKLFTKEYKLYIHRCQTKIVISGIVRILY